MRSLPWKKLWVFGPVILGLSFWSLILQAQQGGVGIYLDFDPPGSGNVVVYAVSYKSPADRAKVKKGDRLLKVDGNEVTGKTLEEIAGWIGGPAGTPVLLVFQNPEGGVRELSIQRQALEKGHTVALPPPSQVGEGVFLTDAEKALVKEKILQLKTDAERQRMQQLLEDLKSQKISKPNFLKAVKTEFP